FKESLNNYLNSVEEITKHSVMNEASLIKARENAYNDLQKRIANVVLKSAAEANKLNYLEVDQKTVDKNKDSFLLADGKPEQDLERDIIQATTKHLASFGLSEETINNVYQTWLPEINTNKNLEETNSIVSETISTIEARNQTIYSHEIKNSDLDYFSDVINKELPNPNEKVEYLTSTLLTKGQLLGAMENSIFSKELDPEEVALPLNVALRESGATFGERKHFFEKWTTNNEISLDLKQLNKDTNKVPILTKEQWNETCKNLNVEPTSIDWRTNEKEQLNRQKLEELVKDLKEDPNVFTEHQERYKSFTISVAMNNAKTENQLVTSLTKYSENSPLEKQISEDEMKNILNKWKLQDINQVKVLSSILTSAGMERKEILNQLSPLGFTKEKQEEISDYIRLVQVRLNQDRFISFNEVKKTSTIINGEEARFKYPYSNEQIINVNPKDTEELVAVFKGAKFLEGADLKQTAFWMDQILLKGGVESSVERKDVLDTWAKNNNLHQEVEYKNLERSAKNYFVGNKKFDEICKTIRLDHLKLPWENKSLLTVKKDEMNAFIESVTKNFTVEKVATEPERIEIRDVMVKALKNVVETESEYREKLTNFMDKLPEKERLNHTEIEEEAKTIKREDYQYVQKALNVEDLAEKTITNYVTVLRTTGLDDEQTKEAIYSWKDRTNLEMDKEKLNDILTKSLVSFNEKEAWGQTPFLSKKQFGDLNKELNVSSPYLWKSTFPSMNMLAKNIWKAVSKAIDQEQAQAQAQAEIQKKVMERQRQGKTKQFQNQNQDRER
ncbi:MAG: hypothetical protein O2U61_04430, partial [Candidatus Bathyarchaeota archaeon]|nr:hypothetical protein [Candidatus Bathyarchaeota archaeon]